MKIYKNTKVKVRSPDGDTNFYDVVTGVLQGDTLAQYLFKIYRDYVLQKSFDIMKESGFTVKNKTNDTAQKLLRTQITLMT